MKLINVVLNMLSMTGLASCIGLNTCPIQMSTNKITFSEHSNSGLLISTTFEIYEDAELSKICMEEDGRTPRKVTLTINENLEPVTSGEVTNLKAGDYWIMEVTPTNGSLPVVNPVKVTVKSRQTAIVVVAEFTTATTWLLPAVLTRATKSSSMSSAIASEGWPMNMPTTVRRNPCIPRTRNPGSPT